MGKVKQIKAKARSRRPKVTSAVKTRDATSNGKGLALAGARKGGRKTSAPPKPVSKGRGKPTGAATVTGSVPARRATGVERKKDARRGTQAARAAAAPPRTIRVRELVPQSICGPRTRVQQVFRVEERMNGSSQTHLVFNDRHGWYCEHGSDCPAVKEVRKGGKSEVTRSSAWTTNGRMRE